MKAATLLRFIVFMFQRISIHAAREGGDCAAASRVAKSTDISIHAAREGGDFDHRHSLPRKAISIHAAREGGDARL